jgi:hypothetical protein
MFGPKPHTYYQRPDLKEPVKKLIVFPVTNFEGIQDANSKKIESAFIGKWSELYGKDNVVPGGPVIFKLMETQGKDTYGQFISSLDNVSAIEQLHKNPKIREFISQVTSKLGQYHLALAIVRGDENSYNAKSEVHLHIGVFDTQNMTWKWITKITDQKGKIGNWTTSSLAMVNNSFDLVKKLENIK